MSEWSRPYISWWLNHLGRTGFAVYPVLGRFQPRLVVNIFLPPRKLLRIACLEFNRRGYKNLVVLDIEAAIFRVALMVDWYPADLRQEDK